MKEFSDGILLALLAENNEQAFTEIYNRYWKLLFAIAYSHVRNIQLTEDIVHDVFASLWAHRGNTEIRSLQNYLASATKYIVFAAIKKKNREQSYLATQAKLYTEPDPELTIDNKMLFEFIKKEVDKLPEKCRLVFKYRSETGLSNQEVAERMITTKKTVENQINKAIRHLRDSIKKMQH